MSDVPDLEGGQTVFVRGTGGAIFEMDVPKDPLARDVFDGRLAKEELVLVEHAEWVERPDGSRYLVATSPAPVSDDESEPAKPRRRKAKAEPGEPGRADVDEGAKAEPGEPGPADVDGEG